MSNTAPNYTEIRSRLEAKWKAARDERRWDDVEFWSNKMAALDSAEKNGWGFTEPRYDAGF